MQMLQQMTLKRHPGLPRLYSSGVRYRQEPPGVDEWIQAPVALARRWDDCEGLASWRAAELRVTGEDPDALTDTRHHGRKWHAFVRRGDGSIEDPSRILGMGRRSARWRRG